MHSITDIQTCIFLLTVLKIKTDKFRLGMVLPKRFFLLGPDHVQVNNCRLKTNCKENLGWLPIVGQASPNFSHNSLSIYN